jgi:tetratricopeptide (TPR) repeat protein
VEVFNAKRTVYSLLFILLTILALTKPCAAGATPWYSARSEHFFLVGHVGALDLQTLAAKLEEFRAVFSQLLPPDYFAAPRPTVIIVFADDAEYTPFKPLHRGQPDQFVAGYFKPGHDLSYITLAADGARGDTTAVLLHEYVHSLVRNRYGRAPVWFNEGLAEYYSAYVLARGQRQVRTGAQLAGRVRQLRTRPLLPLTTLLTVERDSPVYNEHEQRGVFYAQSWAFVHYLLSDRTGARQRQLAELLRLTNDGVVVEEAVRQAFQLEPATLAQRFATYVRAGRYLEQVAALPEPPRPAPPAAISLLSEAEAQAQLGDLLLRTDRPAEARAYLQRALALDPTLVAAHISLGLLHLQDGRIAEATAQLQRATVAAPQNHLAHYYYADLLRREGAETERTVAGYVERTNLIRAEIKRVIELAPDFLDAYGLLVLTDVERNPQLNEATTVLERLLAQAPERRDFKLLLAQLNLRKEEFALARGQLQTLADDPLTDLRLRLQARTLLDGVPAKERIAAERKMSTDGGTGGGQAQGAWQPCDMPEPGPQFKHLRFAGEQVCGRLVKVECDAAGVLLFVQTGARLLKLHSAALNRVRFVTYTTEVRGKMECGARAKPEPVLVTYRPARADGPPTDGELTAVEFVPEDWLH